MKFETKRITAILTALMVAFVFVSLTHAKVVDSVPPVGIWLFEEGSGKRASIRFAFGLCEYMGIRTAALQLRLE